MLEVNVKLNLIQLQKFRKKASNLTDPNGLGKALLQWAGIYRGFAQRRFNAFSKGGGDWPPLADSTKNARRKGTTKSVKVKRKVRKTKMAILRDTNMMFNVLAPTFGGQAGALQEWIANGIVVGYGGPSSYPNGGKASIADIAAMHDQGAGHLPKREIIVGPPQEVLTKMASIMSRELLKNYGES